VTITEEEMTWVTYDRMTAYLEAQEEMVSLDEFISVCKNDNPLPD